MKTLLICIFFIITTSSIYSMPSATRRRINAYSSGGYVHTRDKFIIGNFSDSSDIKMDYEGGPVLLTGLEYNSHNKLSLGVESGYLNITYRDETVHMIPLGINSWSDNSFAQGLFVLRFGFNFSYMHVLKHEFIDYGIAFGPQLSLCYELHEDLYITTNVKYLFFLMNDERKEGHGSTLVPMTVGVIFRL